MSTLDVARTHPGTRCANCGCTEEKSGVPVTTIVADWRTEMLCDHCVASHDWSDWQFDPILNVYYRRS
jgi:hypothetical protein